MNQSLSEIKNNQRKLKEKLNKTEDIKLEKSHTDEYFKMTVKNINEYEHLVGTKSDGNANAINLKWILDLRNAQINNNNKVLGMSAIHEKLSQLDKKANKTSADFYNCPDFKTIEHLLKQKGATKSNCS